MTCESKNTIVPLATANWSSNSIFGASRVYDTSLVSAENTYTNASFNAQKVATLSYYDAAIDELTQTIDLESKQKADEAVYCNLLATTQAEIIDNLFEDLEEITPDDGDSITNWLGTLGTTGASVQTATNAENSARSGRNSANTTTLNNLKATLKTERETKEAAADRLYRNTEQSAWNDYLTSVQSVNTVYLSSIKTAENTYKTASDAADTAYRTTSVTAYISFQETVKTLDTAFYAAVADADDPTFNTTAYFTTTGANPNLPYQKATLANTEKTAKKAGVCPTCNGKKYVWELELHHDSLWNWLIGNENVTSTRKPCGYCTAPQGVDLVSESLFAPDEILEETLGDTRYRETIEISRIEEQGLQGTLYRNKYYTKDLSSLWLGQDDVQYGPSWFEPDLISNVPPTNSLGTPSLVNSFQQVGNGVGVVKDVGVQTFNTVIFIGSLALPGPEDAIWAFAASKYGIKLVAKGSGYALTREGSVLTKKSLEAVADQIQHLQEVIRKVERTTSKYKDFKCVECANALVKLLKKEGIHGKRILLSNPNAEYIIMTDNFGRVISDNGVHQGVLVDGIIYDNIFKNGIKFEEWVKKFEASVPLDWAVWEEF